MFFFQSSNDFISHQFCCELQCCLAAHCWPGRLQHTNVSAVAQKSRNAEGVGVFSSVYHSRKE